MRNATNSAMLFLAVASLVVMSVAPSASGATLIARVDLKTPPPPAKMINTNADPYCTTVHKTDKLMTEEVVVNADGTLKDTFVYISEGVTGTYPTPKNPVILDQVGCHYTPHALGVMAGQPLMIRNSDSTLHNIHPLPKVNTPFNLGMPTKGMTQTRVLPKPEAPFHVKCDVHRWMSGYIAVFNHPFFGVSNDKGVVEIDNLPAGTYTVESWQEKYGAKTQKVTVGANDKKEIVFTY
ncbi:MAG: carboxypeptidase regulatory-like domain-containing protein [Thermoanaerobaculia bacterium]